MPDALAIYGGVAGSAGLLSLGWQVVVRYQEGRTRLVITAAHVDLTIHPDDGRYETAEKYEGLEEWAKTHGERATRYQPGTTVEATNLSKHAIWIRGGGIDQPATGGICAAFQEPTEVKPLTTFRDFWVDDWWAVKEEGMDLKEHPIRAFIDLDDGSTQYSGEIYLYPRPTKRRQKQAAP